MFAAAHRACISVALLCLLFCSPSAGQLLPKAEIAKLGKASTALVELQDKNLLPSGVSTWEWGFPTGVLKACKTCR